MSNKKPNNPTAFPELKITEHPSGTKYKVYYSGVRLRDYFAAKAMQGYITADPDLQWDDDDMIKQSYAIADAMLAERERTP